DADRSAGGERKLGDARALHDDLAGAIDHAPRHGKPGVVHEESREPVAVAALVVVDEHIEPPAGRRINLVRAQPELPAMLSVPLPRMSPSLASSTARRMPCNERLP